MQPAFSESGALPILRSAVRDEFGIQCRRSSGQAPRLPRESRRPVSKRLECNRAARQSGASYHSSAARGEGRRSASRFLGRSSRPDCIRNSKCTGMLRPGCGRGIRRRSLTNEKAYLLGKFARVALRTSNIDYNGRFCMSSAAARGDQGLRHRSRAAVPPGRHRRAPKRSCWSAATRPRRCRRSCSTSRRSAATAAR